MPGRGRGGSAFGGAVFVVAVGVVAGGAVLHGVEDGALDVDVVLREALLSQLDFAGLVHAEARDQKAGTGEVADDGGVGDGQDQRGVGDEQGVASRDGGEQVGGVGVDEK